jgi:hypothetical protein
MVLLALVACRPGGHRRRTSFDANPDAPSMLDEHDLHVSGHYWYQVLYGHLAVAQEGSTSA